MMNSHTLLLAAALAAAACAGGPKNTSTAQPAPPTATNPVAELETPAPDAEPVNEAPAPERERDFGKFVRIELITSKTKESAIFYEKLLGWTINPGADPSYLVIENQGHELAKMRSYDSSKSTPEGWLSWLSVADIDDMIRDVPANGGEVLSAPQPGEDGRMAVVKGPTGGIFGMIELSATARAQRDPQEGDFVLSQLWTDDFESAVSFYSVMGDYNTVEVKYEKTNYSIMLAEGEPSAVIRRAPPGRSTRWIPFVYTANPDEVVSRAKSLRAVIVTPPRDVPTLGRVAVIEAPMGGVLGIIRPDDWDFKSADSDDE